MTEAEDSVYQEILDSDTLSIANTRNASVRHLDTFEINRTSKDKITAIEKFINGKGQMMMFDYSGGCKSTLTSWFNRIRDKLKRQHNHWDSTITHIQITHDFHESFGMNIGQYIEHNRNNTVFTICFTEPIKRILAQYDKVLFIVH